MKRLHINVGVTDLETSKIFYTRLFGVEPVKVKEDYVKWVVDDPRVNFAIQTHSPKKGVDHLGIEVEDLSSLKDVYRNLEKAGEYLMDRGEVTCCYAQSDKAWVFDPDKVAWETFCTISSSPVYGDGKSKRSV